MKRNFLTLDDLDVSGEAEGKYVVVRADLNLPFKDGKITDNSRLVAFIPTLETLKDMGAKIVVLSHFGRPKSRDDKELSLAPIAKELSNLMGEDIIFFEDIRPELQNRQIALRENTRFDNREEKNDASFAKELASLGDIFINDAFSCAHRAHASTEGITHYLKSYAGLLMEAEITALETSLNEPLKPLTTFVGGAKISTKLDLLDNLVRQTDCLVLGGGMANTFLFAKGVKLGKSLYEKDMAETALKILKTAEDHNCEVILPLDAVVAKEIKEGAITEEKDIHSIADDDIVLDIGGKSIERLKKILDNSQTLIWNGPLGLFEIPPFDKGTNTVALYAAEKTFAGKLRSVVGGGDTISALNKSNTTQKMTYASLAGGAFLEWLEGKELPGVKALELHAEREINLEKFA